jgi:hypothetical protein
MDTIETRHGINPGELDIPDAPVMRKAHEGKYTETDPAPPVSGPSMALQWFLHDIPFVAMLLLALTGVIVRMSVTYWVILTPVFAVICIAEGWRHFGNRSERLKLLCGIALSWCALLLAIYLLNDNGVQGVMNANSTSLAMMILLALGTFVAGVQARVWQISAVGVVLFLAVPGLGWLDQSPLLLGAATCLIIGLSGVAWWASDWRQGTARDPAPGKRSR